MVAYHFLKRSGMAEGADRYAITVGTVTLSLCGIVKEMDMEYLLLH